MKKIEAENIIRDYKPHPGFFDLSEKPRSLSKIEYAKILSIQNFLAVQNAKSDYVRKFEPLQWQKLKVLSGQLQQIILQHWGDTVFK